MFTLEQMNKANEQCKSITIKGKKYVTVNERLKAFRAVCPGGTIETQILSLADGVVTMMATVYDEDGAKLGTGHAQEKESSSYINKTSYIENCETSAIGRALATGCGIGIDDSMGSADEIANAILNQTLEQEASPAERKAFIQMAESKGLNPEEVLKKVGWKSGKMTKAHHGKAMELLIKAENDG